MTKSEFYARLIEHLGVENQLMKAVEELNELGQAICKSCSKGENKIKCIEQVVEEIADVEIMLEQVKQIFEIDEKVVGRIKAHKIHRTARKYGIIDERGEA